MKRLTSFFNILTYGLVLLGGSFLAIIIYIFMSENPHESSGELVISDSFALSINSILLSVIMLILILINFKYLKKHIKSFNTKKNLMVSLCILPTAFLINLVVGVLTLLLGASDAISENQIALENMVSASEVLFFFMIVILAPFVEEIVFRASIYELFKPKKVVSKIAVVLFMAITFSFIHDVTILTNFGIDSIAIFLGYFMPALILSSAFALTENIFVPIVGHMLLNLMAFLAILLI